MYFFSSLCSDYQHETVMFGAMTRLAYLYLDKAARLEPFPAGCWRFELLRYVHAVVIPPGGGGGGGGGERAGTAPPSPRGKEAYEDDDDDYDAENNAGFGVDDRLDFTLCPRLEHLDLRFVGYNEGSLVLPAGLKYLFLQQQNLNALVVPASTMLLYCETSMCASGCVSLRRLYNSTVGCVHRGLTVEAECSSDVGAELCSYEHVSRVCRRNSVNLSIDLYVHA